MKVRGTHGQCPGIRSIPPPAGAVATQTMPLVDPLAASHIGREFLTFGKSETGHSGDEKKKQENADLRKTHPTGVPSLHGAV